MALSKIDLCSLALLKIGAQGINSFDEGSAEAEVSSNLYAPIRDALLSAHPWNFALAQETLAKLDANPVADFLHAFQLPSDCLRVLSAGANGRGHGLVYRILHRQIHANTEQLTLTYLRQVGEADYPAFFDIALVARLAAEFCIPLTDSTSRWEAMRRLAEDELRRAKLIDAQEDTPKAFEDFSLVWGRS